MILVQAFARYRERLGWERRDFPLPSPPTLAALLADPLLATDRGAIPLRPGKPNRAASGW